VGGQEAVHVGGWAGSAAERLGGRAVEGHNRRCRASSNAARARAAAARRGRGRRRVDALARVSSENWPKRSLSLVA